MERDTLNINTEQAKLVDALKANDEKVIERFYQENFYKTEKYVLTNHGSTEEAKDIYQDAFLAVWRNIQLEKFKPANGTALAGYLFTISKNKWLDHLRSAHHKKTINIENAELMEPEQTSYINDEENNYLAEVKLHFKNLGQNCKEVLTRFYYYKQSLKEIALSFDWTEATARNNKYRCLQRLRDMLKQNAQ